MEVEGITTRVVRTGDSLEEVLKESLPPLRERDVVVITSKIVSLCEQAVVDPLDESGDPIDMDALIKAESEWYTDPEESQYGIYLSIMHGSLSLNAGIDRSNADGKLVLLPRDSQHSAQKIWEFLRTEHQVHELGVVIIDSVPFPLKWGQTARSLAHCGFLAVHDRIGELDLFGRPIVHTYMSMVEGIAAAAHLEMGEVAECRPVAIVRSVSDVVFQDRPPSTAELNNIRIATEDDAFAPLLKSKLWKKGGAERDS